MKKLVYKVANDNGNSTQKIKINGQLLMQPNVYALPQKPSWVDESTPETLVPNLLDELAVSIQSPAIFNQGFYYIGKKAISSQYKNHGLEIGQEEKYLSDVPIINTLAIISGRAVQEVFQSTKKLPENIEVIVDMATLIPVSEWRNDKAKAFADRFTSSQHNVQVYVGGNIVNVNVKFDYVKVVAEATTAMFAVIEDGQGNIREGDMFTEFNKTYNKNVDGEYFQDKRILHMDIGAGTTEYPITEGYNFDRDFVHGSQNGTGHAIEMAISSFKDVVPNMHKLTRQKYEEYLQDVNHKYHGKAKEHFDKAIRSEVADILKEARKQILAAQNEIDVILVYGGGSIALKPLLYPQLIAECEKIGAELLWIPEKYAVTLNVEGLDIFLNTVVPELKKQQVKK